MLNDLIYHVNEAIKRRNNFNYGVATYKKMRFKKSKYTTEDYLKFYKIGEEVTYQVTIK